MVFLWGAGGMEPGSERSGQTSAYSGGSSFDDPRRWSCTSIYTVTKKKKPNIFCFLYGIFEKVLKGS